MKVLLHTEVITFLLEFDLKHDQKSPKGRYVWESQKPKTKKTKQFKLFVILSRVQMISWKKLAHVKRHLLHKSFVTLLCITGQVLQILPRCSENAGAIPATTGPWGLWSLGHWRSGFSWQTSPLLLILCCSRAYGGRCHRLLPLQLSAGPANQGEREFGRAAWRDGEVRGT